MPTLSRRYENLLVALLFFTWGAVFLDRMSGLYLAPFIAREFHLSNEQVGLLASVLAICWALSTFFFGALSDRIGRRIILIPAVFAFSILSCVSGLVHTFHQLLLVRGLMGIAEGPCWSVMHAILEQTSPPSRRGRNVGIVVSAAALVGLALAPVLSTQIGARFGWRPAFFVAGVPGLVMGLLLSKFVKEPQPHADVDGVGAPHQHGVRASDYLSVLKYRNIWLSCAAAAGFMCWLYLQNVFAPLYIIEVAHKTATTAGFLLGASGFGSFLLGALLPALSDRIGRRPGLLLMAALAMFIPIIILVPFLYAHLWTMAALLFLTNAGQAVAALVLVLIPVESVPVLLAGTAIGLSNLVGETVGATIAPVIGGALAEKHGLGITMWMSFGGMLVVALAAILMKETARTSPRALPNAEAGETHGAQRLRLPPMPA